MFDLGLMRERLLTVAAGRVYFRLSAGEIVRLQGDVKAYLSRGDRALSKVQLLALLEMHFYLCVLSGADKEALSVFHRCRDNLGVNSPKVQAMYATLLQSDGEDAVGYYTKLLQDEYEYSTDPASYVFLSKRLLAARGLEEGSPQMIEQVGALLERFPLDAELWWFMGDQYLCAQGQLSKAAYCFEQVLLSHALQLLRFCTARRGAVVHEQSGAPGELSRALEYALRSVELSETFLRGWSLVYTISKQMKGKDELVQLARSRLQSIEESFNERDSATARYILKAE
ncbi:Emc2p KNAG_0F03460 [Huiozyma naganishii CBS 8797]|uniref:ER membrane protein complex subunit 2 n=1 Tax=Huiozyma naganishii (strain ATCC MYA-139 / BCRC 22969 / CBS 8797 / KCTC 17520 / NBRC 10181 / NCYC 3082 / Yp74L-3) TaxID=1071383 RepID=J7RN97_HUIN7|nr:hypothetical protein KNAG_0F03460 [Kazachstania naganishii CBS 8797]CCK71008.1 hypothetical protein KNAG_0F03460 [Kazachstania naganishii CBS 8797]